MKLRQLIPAPVRRWLQCRIRRFKDSRSGIRSKLSALKNAAHGFSYAVVIEQPIMPGPYLENKIHNIQTGAAGLNDVMIGPGQIFSFWHLLPQPTERNGFKTGRNIIAGSLRHSVGGGLCQLASIVYHTALAAGMHILERHHHSLDIYKEEERFTPLGADAAVVYGYKDLRFVNTHTHPVSLIITVQNSRLCCRLLSAAPIPGTELLFERNFERPFETVVTRRRHNGIWAVVNTAVYQKP